MSGFQFVCIVMILVLVGYGSIVVVLELYERIRLLETVLMRVETKIDTLQKELKAHDEKPEWWTKD